VGLVTQIGGDSGFQWATVHRSNGLSVPRKCKSKR